MRGSSDLALPTRGASSSVAGKLLRGLSIDAASTRRVT